MGLIKKTIKETVMATPSTEPESFTHAVSAHANILIPKRTRRSSMAVPYTRHNYNITIHDDASITITNEDDKVIDIMDFGIAGDSGITSMHFNTDELLWRDSNIEEYLCKLCFTVNGRNYIYEFDGKDFELPKSVTGLGNNFSLLFIIQEATINSEGGNIIGEREVFVSDEFFAVVSSYGQPINYNPIVLEEGKEALIKPLLELVLADDGKLTATDLYIGNNQDAYVRYIVFEGLPYFAVNADIIGMFYNGRGSYPVKMTDSGKIWLPAQVTRQAQTEWKLLIILAWKEVDSEEYVYEWVSQPVTFKVVPNNLLLSNLNTKTGVGSGSKVQANKYSNFVSHDDKYIQTADGHIFFWNEQ